jgi:hypothetical protein
MRSILSAKVAAIIAVLALAQMPGVRAEDRALGPVRWNAADTWKLDSTEFGCAMSIKNARGTILLLGIDRPAGQGILAIADQAWPSLERGRKYPGLELKYNDGKSWRGRATGLESGFYTRFDKKEFMEFLADFATEKSITVRFGGEYVARFLLSGTLAAIGELAQCEESVDANHHSAIHSQTTIRKRPDRQSI